MGGAADDDRGMRVGRVGPDALLLELFGTVSVPLGPGHVEVGARTPVSGRNMPAGTVWSAGYFLSWERPPR